jgi:hypothetical protein
MSIYEFYRKKLEPDTETKLNPKVHGANDVRIANETDLLEIPSWTDAYDSSITEATGSFYC